MAAINDLPGELTITRGVFEAVELVQNQPDLAAITKITGALLLGFAMLEAEVRGIESPVGLDPLLTSLLEEFIDPHAG